MLHVVVQKKKNPGSIPGAAALCFFFFFRLIQLSDLIFVGEEKE